MQEVGKDRTDGRTGKKVTIDNDYLSWSRRVHYWARRWTPNVHDAEDQAQEALALAWEVCLTTGIPFQAAIKLSCKKARWGGKRFAPTHALCIMRGPIKRTAAEFHAPPRFCRLPLPRVGNGNNAHRETLGTVEGWGDPHLGELANHLENLIGTPDHVSAACHDMDFQAWRATLPRRERKVIDLRLRGLTMAETGLIIGKTTQQVFLILQDLKQQIPPALLVRPCKPAKGVR